MGENLPSDTCAQRRIRSACASAQSDQSLRYPHEETLASWLSKERPAKTDQITAQSLMGVHVRRMIFLRLLTNLSFYISSVMQYQNAYTKNENPDQLGQSRRVIRAFAVRTQKHQIII